MGQGLVVNSQPSSESAHNIPNTSGLETSLSFTRRLIEETAARNERQFKDEGKVIGNERDIASVSVSIQSNLIASVAEDAANGAGI